MTNPNFRITRFDEGASMVGKGRSTLWHEIKVGRFVPPISLGTRSSGFIESELQAMIAAKALAFTDDQLKDLVVKLVEQRKEYANRLLEAVAV